MLELLNRQKQAQLREGPPGAAVRIDRIDRCIGLLVDHAVELAEALDQDFGGRSKDYSLLTDIGGAIGPLKHARKHLRRWMRPQVHHTTPGLLRLFGGKAELRHQPKGVVGLMAPWNFPVYLIFSPLAGILAAGNRVMIKPSEFTPATSALLTRLIAEHFSREEIAVVGGDAEAGQAFSTLPFDHLLFTGGTGIGRQVMRAAAENLVPVTLELGGKNPVILSRSADPAAAARRIMAGKGMNAGQVCLAPDYLLVPEERTASVVQHLKAEMARLFPTLRDNPDWTAIINQRHYDRLAGYLADARDKGAQLIAINPASEDLGRAQRKIAPTLVLEVNDNMKLMQEEIFGPLLPVVPYRALEDALAYVNRRERPLAAYYFGNDQNEIEAVLSRITAGGTTVNDILFHLGQEELPFGGVGASGIGAYQGFYGFAEFSHRRAVYQQLKKDVGPMAALRPPYGPATRKFIAGQLKR
jgi:coniferyl-aldehyde dehydrogenase